MSVQSPEAWVPSGLGSGAEKLESWLRARGASHCLWPLVLTGPPYGRMPHPGDRHLLTQSLIQTLFCPGSIPQTLLELMFDTTWKPMPWSSQAPKSSDFFVICKDGIYVLQKHFPLERLWVDCGENARLKPRAFVLSYRSSPYFFEAGSH